MSTISWMHFVLGSRSLPQTVVIMLHSGSFVRFMRQLSRPPFTIQHPLGLESAWQLGFFIHSHLVFRPPAPARHTRAIVFPFLVHNFCKVYHLCSLCSPSSVRGSISVHNPFNSKGSRIPDHEERVCTF